MYCIRFGKVTARVARRLRIGWPRQYTAALGSASYAVTGNDVALTYTPAADTTPNAFTFTDQTGVALSTVITGAAVTVSGLGPGVTVTFNASGGTIDKNGDANFLGSQLLGNGDTFRPRVTSSATNSTSTNCTVVASPSGVQDTFSATTLAGSSPGAVDLSGLGSTTAANTTAYAALNVPSLAAGSVFSDPATSVRTVKLTSSTVPAASQFFPHYSTLGLAISRAWGTNSDWYTIAIGGLNSQTYLVDYQIGGTPTNWRTVAAGEARYCFARTAGNERILYIKGTTLRRYNTATNAFADTGLFPYTWTTNNSADCWLQLNRDDTWATAKYSGGATALNLSTGATINQAIGAFDEIYSGYGTVALINSGTSSRVWNLVTNTLTSITRPNSNFGVTHVPSMNGFWPIFDTNSSAPIDWSRIDETGANSGVTTPSPGWYWGQLHSSGHWTQGASPGSQYFLMSNWAVGSPSANTAHMNYSLNFVKCDDFSKRVLGHHYSVSPAATADDYASQPHATISDDGKIVVFGSNMMDGSRIDAFLMETPRAS